MTIQKYVVSFRQTYRPRLVKILNKREKARVSTNTEANAEQLKWILELSSSNDFLPFCNPKSVFSKEKGLNYKLYAVPFPKISKAADETIKAAGTKQGTTDTAKDCF